MFYARAATLRAPMAKYAMQVCHSPIALTAIATHTRASSNRDAIPATQPPLGPNRTSPRRSIIQKQTIRCWANILKYRVSVVTRAETSRLRSFTIAVPTATSPIRIPASSPNGRMEAAARAATRCRAGARRHSPLPITRRQDFL